jgi:hypothetical protein
MENDGERSRNVSNEMSGNADNVVQAGVIHGGVHFGGPPRRSDVELVDVTVVRPAGRPDESPVLDLKLRNLGEQPAVLKRLVVHVDRALRCGSMFSGMRFTPYWAVWLGATLPVSATYDVAIPEPGQADGAQFTVELSQVIPAGDADRFQLRLGMQPTFDAFVYQLRLELRYDGDDRSLVSPSAAVVFPQHGFVHSLREIFDAVRWFHEETGKVRQAIDAELSARGLPAPDWAANPPRRRADLPDGLLSVDGTGDMFGSSPRSGEIAVTREFWDPAGSVARYLRSFDRMYRDLVEIVDTASVADDILVRSLPVARDVIAGIPAMRRELGVAQGEPESEVADPEPATVQPGALMAEVLSSRGDAEALRKLDSLAELRARLHAGDEGTLWFFERLLMPEHLDGWAAHSGLGNMANMTPVAELLDEFLRLRRPEDREAFTKRAQLARMRAKADPAYSVTALGRLLDDQRRALGDEDPDTCRTRLDLAHAQTAAGDMAAAAASFVAVVRDQERDLGVDNKATLSARHSLGFTRGESGDPAGAVAVFGSLVPDVTRALGADDESTLNARHELARWRGKAGDPATAFAEFGKVVADRTRVQGPDHPHTLLSRYWLAWWRGESGDAAGAAADFARLLDDRKRVLGARHEAIGKTEQALAHWRERAASGGSMG